MARPTQTNQCSIILLLILFAAATADARSRGGARSLPRQTSTAYHHSLDEAEQDYSTWEATHDTNRVQGCSAKFNDTMNSLTDELLDLSNNTTTDSSPTGAPRNLTSYAEERVKAAESERIRCATTYLEPNHSHALTTHFTLISLPFVILLLFSIFVLF